MAKTRIAGRNQMQEWNNIIKHDPATFGATEPQVLKDFTLQYDSEVAITEDNDLVTKKYVDDAKTEAGKIGIPTDGSFTDGLIELTPTTTVADATDNINELLAELAPANANSLTGQDLTSSVTKYSGYLSQSGTAAYKAGAGAGNSVNYIIKNAAFTMSTPSTSTSINNGDMGTLNLYINNVMVDSFDLGSNFNEANRNASQIYTPLVSAGGFITVTSVSKYNGFKKWQKCVATLNIPITATVEGYNYIILKHEGLVTVQTSNEWICFCDKDAGANPAVTNVLLTTGNLNSNKYLSGVRFFGLNDTMKLSATGNNLFNNVYVQSPIAYSGFTGISNGTVTVVDSAVSGVSVPPTVGNVLTVTDKVLTLSAANQCTANARITVTPSDPYGNYTAVQSSSQAILVHTYADGASGTSTDKLEAFTTEYYRLPLSFDAESKVAAIIGQWNSQLELTNGNAQVYLNGTTPALVYPSVDLTSAKPEQTINYSAFNGMQQYLRCFLSTSSKTNVALQLDGVTAGIGMLGTGDINVEIKLPSQTSWLDAAKAFNPGQGVNVDGNGCLNGAITYGANATINITFGGKATYDSANRMYVRITLRNSNRVINKITCVGW